MNIMIYRLILIPFIAAVTGYLLHRCITWFYLKYYFETLKTRAAKIVGAYARNFFDNYPVQEKLADPSIINNAMPLIRQHIDEFIDVKLQEKIPMMSMVAGTKITDQVKDVFLEQVQQIFPQLMQRVAEEMKTRLDVENSVSTAIRQVSYETFTQSSAKLLNKFYLWGLLAGFIIGLVNLAIFYIIINMP